MITLNIDVTLLDKARFKRITKKDGSQAVYCDLVLIENPSGKYGDFMVKQSVTKEERQARKEMPIIGNGKDWSNQSSAPAPAPKKESPISEEDVPF